MRRRDYRYAFCVHAGIVRGVWRVTGWDPESDWSSGGRRALVGEPATDLWSTHVGGWVGEYLPHGVGRCHSPSCSKRDPRFSGRQWILQCSAIRRQ